MQKKRTKTSTTTLTPVYRLWAWILLFWSLYRYFIHLPEWADEFVIKPLVFVAPVIWYVVTRERRRLESLGLTTKNLFTSIYIGLGFGFIFALEGLAANAIKYGKLTIAPIAAFDQYGLIVLMLLSLATAVSEEILSRGFLFTRIYEKTKSLPYASMLSTLMFVSLHVPILVTSLKLQGFTLILFFVTNLILGFANSLLMYNTRSIVAPILVHLFWNMTVALYL
jgi:membrane protease YdiL (CAAX protease family)